MTGVAPATVASAFLRLESAKRSYELLTNLASRHRISTYLHRRIIFAYKLHHTDVTGQTMLEPHFLAMRITRRTDDPSYEWSNDLDNLI
jgi:hypothetical protein